MILGHLIEEICVKCASYLVVTAGRRVGIVGEL